MSVESAGKIVNAPLTRLKLNQISQMVCVWDRWVIWYNSSGCCSLFWLTAARFTQLYLSSLKPWDIYPLLLFPLSSKTQSWRGNVSLDLLSVISLDFYFYFILSKWIECMTFCNDPHTDAVIEDSLFKARSRKLNRWLNRHFCPLGYHLECRCQWQESHGQRQWEERWRAGEEELMPLSRRHNPTRRKTS